MDTATTPVITLHLAALQLERDALYQVMVDCNRHGQMLYDDDRYTSWQRLSSPATAWTYGVHADDALAAVLVVDGFVGRAAFVHFCVLEGCDHLAVLMGRTVVRWLLEHRSCLLGATPSCYRHVLRFVQHIGFQRQFVVPDAHYIATHQRHVDGIVSMATLQSFEEACRDSQ